MRGPHQHPPADEGARPAEPSFLKSPFLYTPADQELGPEQKQDLLSSVLSKIILEQVRPAQSTHRTGSTSSTSSRALLTLLSLLSLTQAEVVTEAPLPPRLYQTKFQEATRSASGSRGGGAEKPFFDTVDVVIGAQQRTTPRYPGRPQRQVDVPQPVRLSGRSGGLGGDGGVESVSSSPSFYPQSVSWAPPQEQPTDRRKIEKESPEKVI